MKPPPPRPLIHGSTTATLNAAVTAASTAFPPRSSTSRAASTAHGCFAATIWRGAIARSRETFSEVRAGIQRIFGSPFPTIHCLTDAASVLALRMVPYVGHAQDHRVSERRG